MRNHGPLWASAWSAKKRPAFSTHCRPTSEPGCDHVAVRPGFLSPDALESFTVTLRVKAMCCPGFWGSSRAVFGLV